jgi:hypothetical protein
MHFILFEYGVLNTLCNSLKLYTWWELASYKAMGIKNFAVLERVTLADYCQLSTSRQKKSVIIFNKTTHLLAKAHDIFGTTISKLYFVIIGTAKVMNQKGKFTRWHHLGVAAILIFNITQACSYNISVVLSIATQD